MKKELKSKVFETRFALTEFVNNNNVKAVSITFDAAWSNFTLFYEEHVMTREEQEELEACGYAIACLEASEL